VWTGVVWIVWTSLVVRSGVQDGLLNLGEVTNVTKWLEEWVMEILRQYFGYFVSR
jgi:hypothetical protein